ncbi:hypothetical protein HK099_005261 [Clydaea vesicula]|uniref:sn-1-specific diacylglycerol lipase n=1 Tax=Clydaea vesicula TaxID=447962 RepID=A0AAD5U6J2_9FUNG|nr:hypothetical protein HK099_005261 [Clydaea vesicula]
MLTSIILLCVLVPMELLTAILSMSGTIASKGPRKYVAPLIHGHIILLFAELILHSFGFYAIYGTNSLYTVKDDNCKVSAKSQLNLLYLVVYFSFITLFLWLTVLMGLLYLSRKKNKVANFHKFQELWKNRLRWLVYYCKKFTGFDANLTANSNDVISDVAGVLADYFLDVDWTPSDIAAGLILLKRKQKSKAEELYERTRMEAMKAGIAEKRANTILEKLFDEKANLSAETLNITEAGSGVYKVERNTSEVTLNNEQSVEEKVSFTGTDVYMQDDEISIVPDKNFLNVPLENTKVPLYVTKTENSILHKEDIPDIIHFSKYMEMMYSPTAPKEADHVLHFNDKNDVFQSPYLVALDHDWETIVVAIRGTFSLADLLVDLKIEVMEYKIPELGENVPTQYTHSGFFKVASTIMADINKENLLKDLRDENSKYSHYKIVVTGHSLGAAAGALLTYMLRSNGFLEAICYAYDPPGMLLTYESSVYFEEFVISIVNGDDFVSRLSLHSMELLKLDIARVLNNCDEHKWEVLGSSFMNFYFGRNRKFRPKFPQLGRKSSSVEKAENNDAFSVPYSNRESFEVSDEVKSPFDVQSSVDVLSIPKLYMPGRLLYLEKCRMWDDGKDDLSFFSTRHFKKNSNQLSKIFPWLKDSFKDCNNDCDNLPFYFHAKTKTNEPISFRPSIKGKYAYCPRWSDREEFSKVLISKSMFSDHWCLPILLEMGKFKIGEDIKVQIEE